MSWPLVAIKEVAKVVTGKTPSTVDEQNFGGNIPFVTPAELGLEAYVTSAPRTLSAKGASAIKLVPKNAVMVCCIGSLGKMAIAGTPVATNQQINSVIFDENRVDAKYGFYALQLLKPKMEAMAPSTTVAIVNKGNFEAMQIPLPPLPEQKRIAAILDKADAIRRKRQQAIQLADDFLRTVFLDMFGDPVTNPKGWPLKRFGDVGTWSSGGTPSRTVSDFFEGEINWYSAGELNSRYLDGSVEKISESAIKNSAAKIFKKDSLLVGMYDTAAMKISILKEDSSCNQACANVECNELASVEWLYSYIDYAKDSYLSRRRGVRQKNLNLGMIRDFLLPLPPRDLQHEFVRFVSAVFGMKKKQDECKDFPVFESLSLKAFSGQL